MSEHRCELAYEQILAMIRNLANDESFSIRKRLWALQSIEEEASDIYSAIEDSIGEGSRNELPSVD